MEIVEKDKLVLERDLAKAIIKMSKGSVSIDVAESVANHVVPQLDFSNSAVAHKGVNWFAKEIIDNYDLSAVI